MILRLVLVVTPSGGGDWEAAAYPARPRERKTGHGAGRTAYGAAAMAIREVVGWELRIERAWPRRRQAKALRRPAAVGGLR